MSLRGNGHANNGYGQNTYQPRGFQPLAYHFQNSHPQYQYAGDEYDQYNHDDTRSENSYANSQHGSSSSYSLLKFMAGRSQKLELKNKHYVTTKRKLPQDTETPNTYTISQGSMKGDPRGQVLERFVGNKYKQ